MGNEAGVGRTEGRYKTDSKPEKSLPATEGWGLMQSARRLQKRIQQM